MVRVPLERGVKHVFGGRGHISAVPLAGVPARESGARFQRHDLDEKREFRFPVGKQGFGPGASGVSDMVFQQSAQ